MSQGKWIKMGMKITNIDHQRLTFISVRAKLLHHTIIMIHLDQRSNMEEKKM